MGMFDKYNDSVLFSNPCPPGCETCCPLDIQLAYDPITNVLTLTYIYDNATVVRTVNLTDLQEPLTIGLTFNPTTNIITLAGTYAGVPFSNTIDITHSHDLELILNGTFLELTGEHDGEQVITSVDLSPIIFSATGPAGPQGPAGNNGAAGPQGVPGPVGPAGLNWTSTWAPLSIYAVDDAVAYNGASYFCINPVGPSLTTPDIDPINWALLAGQGATGPQGPQGLSGPQGSTGPQGPIGLTGPQGPAGNNGGFTHYVGEQYGGGIVFYVYKDPLTLIETCLIYGGDFGASTWSNITNIQAITNPSDANKSYYDGYNNTIVITSQAGCISGAAFICSNASIGIYSDWYLPSISELMLLYNNRFIVNQVINSLNMPLLSASNVWSSTEANNIFAKSCNMVSGVEDLTLKTQLLQVFPIRKTT